MLTMKILRSLVSSLRPANSVLARRIAFPLQHRGAGPVRVQPSDRATCACQTTGGLKDGRLYHTATLLPNGRVLVAGGIGNGIFPASAELYDSASGTWTET